MAWMGFGALTTGTGLGIQLISCFYKCVFCVFRAILIRIFTVLQRLLGVDAPPNKVQEVKTDTLEHLQILHRDDGMFMYAPPLGSTEKKTIYEIVVHRPYADTINTSYR